MTGLDAFAARENRQRANRCACCALRAARPEVWQDVLNGRARPTPHPYPTIARYLHSLGLNITPNMLRDHFHLGHEETR